MKIGYFVKALGQTIKDARYFMSASSIDLDDMNNSVETACDYAWDEDDGDDWLVDGIVLTMVVNDIVIGDFVVGVNFEPVFFMRGESVSKVGES